MSIQVAAHMARKSVMKDMSGNIINLIDETDGGYIIRNRQVVNQEKWERMCKEAQDKKDAAKAQANAISAPPEVEAMRTGTAKSATAPKDDRLDSLEKRIDGQDAKLDAILKALGK